VGSFALAIAPTNQLKTLFQLALKKENDNFNFFASQL
jgi:hypothetical protein